MQQLTVMENMVSEIKVMTKMVEQDIKTMKSDINYLKVENKDLQLEVKNNNIRFKEIEDKTSNALEKITLRNADEFGEDWLGQKDIGLLFEPNLSSHQVGHMLRATGFAMKKRSKTTPTQATITRGFCRRNVNNNYDGLQWYAPKIKKSFVKYFKNKGVYEEILNAIDTKTITEIIFKIK